MTVFGDLDVSTIRTMPEGRAGIQTLRRARSPRSPAWFARVWERIAEEVAQGRQAFVVCAAIDADAVAEGRHRRRAGRRRSRARRRARAGASCRSPTCCRGIPRSPTSGSRSCTARCRRTRRMPSCRRSRAATSTCSWRRRSSRSASTCRTRRRWRSSRPTGSASRSCTSCAAASAAAGCPDSACSSPRRRRARRRAQRVEAVAATLDGFELAEVDLELRGEGDVLGDAQSGARSSLRLLRVVKDADLIAEARDRRRAAARRGPRADAASRASPRRSSGASAWRSARRWRRADAARRR